MSASPPLASKDYTKFFFVTGCVLLAASLFIPLAFSLLDKANALAYFGKSQRLISVLALAGVLVATICAKSSQLTKSRWVFAFGVIAICLTTYSDMALRIAVPPPAASQPTPTSPTVRPVP